MIELKFTIDFDATGIEGVMRNYSNRDIIVLALDMLQRHCHAASYNRGWWHDPITGKSLIPGHTDVNGSFDMGTTFTHEMRKAWFPYVIGTKIALIHSEVSEGLEAYRVDKVDDKIPFPGIVAEMGDAVIRIADLMGCLREYAMTQQPWQRAADRADVSDAYSLGAAIMAKLPVNVGRPDHSLEARTKPGGKKF